MLSLARTLCLPSCPPFRGLVAMAQVFQDLFGMKWFMLRLCAYSGSALCVASRELTTDIDVIQVAEWAILPPLVSSSSGESLLAAVQFGAVVD